MKKQTTPPAPSVLEVLNLAESTIERLTVKHGPFSSTQGTLDVIRAAKTGLVRHPAADLITALVHAFPGLVTGKDDVNGGDLVEWLSERADTLIEHTGRVETLSVCADCLQVVAFGDEVQNDLDADREGEILVAIRAYLEAHPGATLHAGELCDEFSARPCELCGSALAGERRAVHVIGGSHGE